MLADPLSPYGHASSTMQQQNLLGLAGMGYPELQLLSNLGSLMGQQQFQEQQKEDDERGARGGGRTRSGDSRSSSAYASRHQAAEQRRRNRINERLELLRKLVPHAERANTACFLEEVIKYVEQLRNRNAALEKMVNELQTGAAAGSMAAPPAATAAAASAAPAASLPGPTPAGPSAADLQQSPSPAAAGPGLAQVAVEQQDAAAAAGTQTSAAAAAPARQQQTTTAPDAALAAAGPAAAAPAPSTSQALMGLQGLLPDGIDVQSLLQQALINAQAQLLQQHQQHQAALAASSGGPAASGGAAVSTGNQQQQKLGSQQQQQPQQSMDTQQQQQQQQPILQSPPDLVLQPTAQTQPSILDTLSGGPASAGKTIGQPQQQLQQQPDIFTAAAKPAASSTSPSGATTLPPELRKLKAKLDSQTTAYDSASADLASLTAAGAAHGSGALQQQTTAPLLAAAPGLALPATNGLSQGVASGLGLSSAFAGLSGATGGIGNFSNYHMGRSQLLAAAAAAADDMEGAALMAGLSAVAAAGAADNAAAISVAERASSLASGHDEGEEGENTVPHKKRKMLVL